MSIESRLLRGDDPADVAALFNIEADDARAMLAKLKPKGNVRKAAPKKKAAKKK